MQEWRDQFGAFHPENEWALAASATPVSGVTSDRKPGVAPLSHCTLPVVCAGRARLSTGIF